MNNKKIPSEFYEYKGIGIIRFEIINEEKTKLELDLFDFKYNLKTLPIKCLDENNLELLKKQIKEDGAELVMMSIYIEDIDFFMSKKISIVKNRDKETILFDIFDYCNPNESHEIHLERTIEILPKDKCLINIPSESTMGIVFYTHAKNEKPSNINPLTL